jgi:hypothetical protein
MKKKLVNIDRPPITDTEIAEFKNFNLLMKKHAAGKSGFPKLNIRNILFTSFIGVALIAIVLFLYYSISTTPVKHIDLATPGIKQAYVNPPVKSWDVPFKSVLISNNKDTLIRLKSGSCIKIPANSLEGYDGSAATPQVEIRYREFPSPVEIFLAGIPMVYDSAGVRNQFESAGMIEIYAYRGNSPLRLKSGKEIEIALTSTNEQNNFNLYYLDTAKRNWTYKGRERLQIISPKAKARLSKRPAKMDGRLENFSNTILPREIPDLPLMANNMKWHIKLDIIDNEFPELKKFSSTIFEIDDSYRPLNKVHAKVAWDDIVLTKGPRSMTYFLKFSAGRDSCKYLVKPVLPESEYKIAKAKYDTVFKEYNEALALRRLEASKMKSDSVMYARLSEEALATRSVIFRSFFIQNFGIWNCDRVRKLPFERSIEPEFTINQANYELTSFLADITANSIITNYPGTVIKYNPKAENMLWTVTEDNRVAVFTQSEFNRLPKTSFRHRLTMRVLKTPINSADDFIRLYKAKFEE